MISKELLSTVLEIPLDSIGDIHYKDSHVIYGVFTINIYELAHRCKEWAYRNGYQMQVNAFDMLKSFFKQYENELQYEVRISGFGAGYKLFKSQRNVSETEAIFESCEWILKEIDNGLVQ